MLANFATRIESIINRLGRDITHRTVTKSGMSFDPTSNIVDVTIRGVVFDYSTDEIDGSIIQQGDKEFVISTNAVTLKKSALLVDNGVVYTILSFEEVQPGSAKLMYIVHGRA